MAELDGKVAIVTGAGRLRGIGRATAVALAQRGADLVITGTPRDPATFPPDEKKVRWHGIESTAEQIRAQGRRALPLVVDVTNEEQVQAMVEDSIQAFGCVDILINNAAFARGADRVSLADLDSNTFQSVVDVKVRGTYLCTKMVVQHLISRGEGGKIVNVSSGSGKLGMAKRLAYTAASFAQVGMTESMARELGSHGINVNCVCPGPVDTSRLDDLGRETKWQELAASIVIGRTGTDEEVGQFITYLCTAAASWIHGQAISINGGGYA